MIILLKLFGDMDMFKNKTLFILGAGASVPYGFPTGAGLINEIIISIENDSAWMPKGSYDYSLIYMKNTMQENIYNIPDPNTRKLSSIKELTDFKSDLIKHRPTSIDSFVDFHPQHEKAAKLMIAYVLLFKEKKIFLEDYPDDWYSNFITDLLLGCENAYDFKEKNKHVKIATFNYDESFEYFFLKRVLLESSKFCQNIEDQKLIINFIRENVIHIHGQIHGIDKLTDNYGSHNRYDRSKKGNPVEISFVYLLKIFENIKLTHRKDKAVLKISDFEDIYIIGFSFDRDNLYKIGFPDNYNSYITERGEIKSINWLDFGGKMNALHEQFQEILKHKFKKPLRINRSIATRISDAYQNDFKVRLF